MSTKKRKPNQPRLNHSAFFIIWLFAHVILFRLATFVLFDLTQLLSPDGFLPAVISLLAGFSIPVAWIIGQGLLMRFQYGWSLSRWAKVNTLGILAGISLYIPLVIGTQFLVTLLNTSAFISFIPLVGLIPIVIAQVWVLRHYVRNAWLWGLGTIVAFVMMPIGQNLIPINSLFANLDIINTMYAVTAGSMFSFISGLTLIGLVAITRNDEVQQLRHLHKNEKHLEQAKETLENHINESDHNKNYQHASQNYHYKSKH